MLLWRPVVMVLAAWTGVADTSFIHNTLTEGQVPVSVESPGSNMRTITSAIIVNRPVDDVWSVITQYDRLADFLPNLKQSRVVPREREGDGIVRLFQEGAQSLMGLNFRVSLTLDLEEVRESKRHRRLRFTMVDSALLSEFQGEWQLYECTRDGKRTTGRGPDNADPDDVFTKLVYTVTAKPKCVVPVKFLEWRIQMDIPQNLKAMKRVVESLPTGYHTVKDALTALLKSGSLNEPSGDLEERVGKATARCTASRLVSLSPADTELAKCASI